MAEKNTGGVAVVDEWLEANGLMLIESWARDGQYKTLQRVLVLSSRR